MKKIFSLILLTIFLTVISTLTSCVGDVILIYTAAEDERNAYIQEELEKKFPETPIILQSMGSGNLVSKLQAEDKMTDCDIFYDLEVTNAEIVLNANPNLFYDLSEYDFTIYKDDYLGYTDTHKKYAINGKVNAGILINKDLINSKNIQIPKTYNDLLKSEYEGLISMPNPKSSGTGYCFYNGIISSLGEEEGLKYFERLNNNVKEFTSSGSAPVKSVQRGDVAIGVGLLWQCVNYANANDNLEVLILEDKLPYNLFTMGIINTHEEKPMVKEIFDYLYNELNLNQVALYNPDKLYKNQDLPKINNYPTSYADIKMNGVFDYKYKENLLDNWKW